MIRPKTCARHDQKTARNDEFRHTVRKWNAHDATTAKLINDLNPPPTVIKHVVSPTCKHIAFSGVLSVLWWRPNKAGRYPSRPATEISRAEVKELPVLFWLERGDASALNNLLLSAPKQENATMSAKTTPPIGPKSARPKSRATVLLAATVFCIEL